MAHKEIRITKEGKAKLESELEHLTAIKRPEVAEKIKRAREMGGTENNAEYDEAKNDQAFVEGKILSLENILWNATVVDSASSEMVDLGTKVLIQNQDGKIELYSIVGSAEANPVDGKISDESPVGQALIGKKPGDEIEVQTPAGILKLLILEIS
jgi:transcription elongation factor GreA